MAISLTWSFPNQYRKTLHGFKAQWSQVICVRYGYNHLPRSTIVLEFFNPSGQLRFVLDGINLSIWATISSAYLLKFSYTCTRTHPRPKGHPLRFSSFYPGRYAHSTAMSFLFLSQYLIGSRLELRKLIMS